MKRVSIVPTLAFLASILSTLEPARASERLALEQLERSRAKYTTAEAWAKRRAELRRSFLEGAGMWPLPERMPVKAVVRDRRTYEGYTVENVAMETLPGFYCTGNLYRPTTHDKPGPAILHPHGHFQPLGRFREEQQVACVQFARMGATVFSYAMVGWQDSQQTTHKDPLVLALQTWNSIQALDFVSGLEGTDPTRIGVTGASGGGTQSVYLALVDDRIKASAPVVIVYPWTEEDGCRCEGGLPVMSRAGSNAIELAAATSPRPQLLISVGHDSTKTFPTVGFPFIQQMYKVAGAPGAVHNAHFPEEEHDFGPSKLREVSRFFVETLGLKPIPDNTAKTAIEPPKALEVFNAEHPLPPNAIHGTDAVAKAFASVFRSPPHQDTVKSSSTFDVPLVEYAFKPYTSADDATLFTPHGQEKIGIPAEAKGPETAHLKLVVKDKATGKQTACRINVVGSDGNYYEPREGRLKRYSLTGQWPGKGWGNRFDKAPIRYFGRFFYTTGEAEVDVPAGATRVEVWKGFEHRPETRSLTLRKGESQTIEVSLEHTVDMPKLGYESGDPHIHIPRQNDQDDEAIFDLMEAENIRHGGVLAYNEPAGPYTGLMEKLASPQAQGLGKRSIRTRGSYQMISGQEYRGATYGHMNLFLLDELVMPGESGNANNWPLYGDVVRKAHESGGVAFYAHGGYAQSIYADVAQGNIDAVELLQFGVYRGIGLTDWYRMLNSGFRLPAVAACDYPACRKLGDSITYVHTNPQHSIAGWLRSASAGQGFVTTGPLLLLELDGQKPGATLEKNGPGPHPTLARLRVRSEATPVTNLQIIVNGRVVRENVISRQAGLGQWVELECPIEFDRSGWVAARAYSLSRLGTPDAEAHTNPVYVNVNGKAPYERSSLDVLIQRLDGQIAAHKARTFPEKARVLAYFDRSRDILLKIRDVVGAPAKGHPADLVRDPSDLTDPGQRTHTEAELRDYLKPTPPRPIEEVLRTFETVDGFRMELVAQEPLIHSPTAAAFDEEGNLYVAEMVDYPYKPKPGQEPLGSIRMLVDTDGDGRFDQGHRFADHLLWAAGIAPWKGGVFVASPPDIWYLKDTDGDHRADIREKVFSGFGTKNQQAMLNNLQWGPDHRIYGSTAGNGGAIRRADLPSAPSIAIDGRDFRFDPRSRGFEAITGTIQFGNTFDDWGNRFLCSESEPLLHVVLPLHYLARNPYLPAPSAIQDLAPAPVPIFRISPIERWRQIRSSRRIANNARPATSAGASHHVVDAAAGVTIYRGGAYPAKYYGTAFVGDAQNNLVHRRILEPDGVTFRSRRADEGTEVVRSPDIWFRPVNFVNAPDGTLYVLDMSREYLESIHIPNDVVKYLDLTSGRDHGRIYRLAPPEFRYPGPPHLGRATTAELVATLESPHGWWRDTAHRLLYERQDLAAVPRLRTLLEESSRPQSRIHALWSLQGLAALTDQDLLRGLADPDHHVLISTLQLAEPKLDQAPDVLEKVLALNPTEPSIRFQLAFTLGQSKDPRAALALGRVARSSAADPWIRTAILSSAAHSSVSLIANLLDDPAFLSSSSGLALIADLAALTGSRKQPTELGQVLERLATSPALSQNTALRSHIVLALGEAQKRAGEALDLAKEAPEPAHTLLRSLEADSLRMARESEAKVEDRRNAVRFLSCLAFPRVKETLEALLDIHQPSSIQVAALQALAGYSDDTIPSIVLPHWKEYVPEVRKQALETLLNRDGHAQVFLKAVERGDVNASQIDPSWRSRLLAHRNEAIRLLAGRLLGKGTSATRQQVIEGYRAALKLDSDPKRGKTVFTRECSACHKIGDTGHVVGPDLTSSSSRDSETLLTHILDPGRDVLPNFIQYQIEDRDGRTFSGLIASQSATSITLKKEAGQTETILRSRIEQMTSSGSSLMPEGFELKIRPQEMADLIAFLQASRVPTSRDEPPLDIGTEPGITEPETAAKNGRQ